MARPWAPRLAVGALLASVGAALAFVEPPRFYAPFALGSWLVLDALCEARWGAGVGASLRTAQGRRRALALYGVFAAMGVVNDLLLGITITGLWTYPTYDHPLWYASLYLVVYPAGGFFTYSLLGLLAPPGAWAAPSARPHAMAWASAWAAALAALVAAGLAAPPSDPWARVTVYGAGFVLEIGLLESVARARGSRGPVGVLLRQPALVPLVLGASLFGCFLHEWPNLPLEEWRYQNLPLPQPILGVPLTVLAGWPMLLLLPWAAANALAPRGQAPFPGAGR